MPRLPPTLPSRAHRRTLARQEVQKAAQHTEEDVSLHRKRAAVSVDKYRKNI